MIYFKDALGEFIKSNCTPIHTHIEVAKPEESQTEICQKVIDDILKFQSYNETTEHALNHLLKNFTIQRKKQ